MITDVNRQKTHNTCEAYSIRLNRHGLLSEEDLKRHIDLETYTYKHWHMGALKLRSTAKGRLEYLNSNGNISYVLTIAITDRKLWVSCDCNRRVEGLCHHAYTALKHLISKRGEGMFLPHFGTETPDMEK